MPGPRRAFRHDLSAHHGFVDGGAVAHEILPRGDETLERGVDIAMNP